LKRRFEAHRADEPTQLFDEVVQKLGDMQLDAEAEMPSDNSVFTSTMSLSSHTRSLLMPGLLPCKSAAPIFPGTPSIPT
jgi:hypothetical protein